MCVSRGGAKYTHFSSDTCIKKSLSVTGTGINYMLFVIIEYVCVSGGVSKRERHGNKGYYLKALLYHCSLQGFFVC